MSDKNGGGADYEEEQKPDDALLTKLLQERASARASTGADATSPHVDAKAFLQWRAARASSRPDAPRRAWGSAIMVVELTASPSSTPRLEDARRALLRLGAQISELPANQPGSHSALMACFDVGTGGFGAQPWRADVVSRLGGALLRLLPPGSGVGGVVGLGRGWLRQGGAGGPVVEQVDYAARAMRPGQLLCTQEAALAIEALLPEWSFLPVDAVVPSQPEATQLSRALGLAPPDSIQLFVPKPLLQSLTTDAHPDRVPVSPPPPPLTHPDVLRALLFQIGGMTDFPTALLTSCLRGRSALGSSPYERLYRAQAERLLGHHEAALATLETITLNESDVNDAVLRAAAQRERAYCHLEQGNLPAATEQLVVAQRSATEAGHPATTIHNRVCQAALLHRKNEDQLGREALRGALEEAQHLGDANLIGLIELAQARSHKRVGGHDKARHHLLKANDAFLESDNVAGRLAIHRLLGQKALDTENYNAALDHLEARRLLASTLQIPGETALATVDIARALEATGNEEVALENLEAALETLSDAPSSALKVLSEAASQLRDRHCPR